MRDPWEPKRGPRVAVSDHLMIGSLAITLAIDHGGIQIQIAEGIDEQGQLVWTEHDRLTAVEHPTFVLQEEMARELHIALSWYYREHSVSTDREDLLHERSRVDKLIATVSSIAEIAATGGE